MKRLGCVLLLLAVPSCCSAQTVELKDGTLEITGTKDRETIVIYPKDQVFRPPNAAKEIEVWVTTFRRNGKPRKTQKLFFPRVAVLRIEADFKEGDDQFHCTLPIPATVDGGAGNDVLTCGDADDVIISGPGGDSVSTGGGANTVHITGDGSWARGPDESLLEYRSRDRITPYIAGTYPPQPPQQNTILPDETDK